MSLASGPVAIRRYRYGNPRLKVGGPRFSRLIAGHKLGPLEIHRREELRYGWVRPQLYPTQEQGEGVLASEWSATDCSFQQGYALRIRVEKRNVPSPLLAEVYRQKYLSLAQSAKKPPTQKEKSALRDRLKSDLRKSTLPLISYVEGIWALDTAEVWCLAAGKLANKIFLDLFQKTFADPLKIQLIPVEPALAGLSAEEWCDPELAGPLLDRLSSTVPALFDDVTV